MVGRVAGDMLRPGIETRTPAEQTALDQPSYRLQLNYLFANSVFYQRKLQAAGFRSVRDVGELSDIANLPFTEKDEIRASQAEAPPFGTHVAAPRDKIARVFSTSGTTGDPVYIPVTKADVAMWVEISSRSYFATGMRPGMTITSTYNAGPFVAGVALDTVASLGLCHVPVGTGNTARLVRALQLIRPEGLLCTPSYAVYLAEHLADHGIAADQLGLRRISVAGEPGGGDTLIRERLQTAFGAMVCEAMGIGDVSISLWGECDAQQGMHFCGGDYVHVELIDPETEKPVPIEDGARGELVYTALQREAAPMLRFRSRDHVVIHTGRCTCGRSTMRVRCIGRTDDLLIVRGVNVFPTAIRSIIAEFAPQVSGAIAIRPTSKGVRQDPPLPIAVELGGDAAADSGLAQAIEQAIRARLVVGTKIELVPYGSLPRSEYKTKLVDFSLADQ